MTDATELDEAAVRARLEAATPGPWHGSGGGLAVYGATIGDLVAEFRRRADATFVRHARTDVERLLAALDEARAEVAEIAATALTIDRERMAAESALAAVRAVRDHYASPTAFPADGLVPVASVVSRLDAALDPTSTPNAVSEGGHS